MSLTSVLSRAFAQDTASSGLRNSTKATPRLRLVTLSFNIVTLKNNAKLTLAQWNAIRLQGTSNFI